MFSSLTGFVLISRLEKLLTAITSPPLPFQGSDNSKWFLFLSPRSQNNLTWCSATSQYFYPTSNALLTGESFHESWLDPGGDCDTTIVCLFESHYHVFCCHAHSPRPMAPKKLGPIVGFQPMWTPATPILRVKSLSTMQLPNSLPWWFNYSRRSFVLEYKEFKPQIHLQPLMQKPKGKI